MNNFFQSLIMLYILVQANIWHLRWPIYIYIYICIFIFIYIYIYKRICARVFRWRESPAVGISLLRSSLRVEGLPSSWNFALALESSGGGAPQQLEFTLAGSTHWEFHLPESSTPWEFHLPESSTPWEFHSPGSSTLLGVPLLWEFHRSGSSTPLEFHSSGSSTSWEFSCESSSQGFTELWPPNWVKLTPCI